jgi:hypothetical protein
MPAGAYLIGMIYKYRWKIKEKRNHFSNRFLKPVLPMAIKNKGLEHE